MTTIAAIPFVFLSMHLLYSDQANDSLFETSGYPKPGDIPILNRKIFKGVRVAIREHPYVVSIRRQCAHILTGTLISRNLVLTVAHPIYLIPIHELGVVAGENYADRGTTLLTVILLIVHENFDPYTLHHDIAILHIYEDAAMKTSVKIVGFVSSQRSLANKKAFVTGWGRCDITGRELCLPRTSIYYPNELLDPMLRSIMFHITEPNYYCDGYTKQDITLGPGMMCMGEAREANPVTPCLAVPGAPMVVNGYLAGIQSWGFGCGYSNDLPLIYTSIQYYKQWIMHNRDILLALWKSNYTELFEATKAYTSRAWLKETRVITPTSRDFPKDLQQTDLDTHLAKLRGYYYDIRDFVFDGRYHKQKRDFVNTIRQIEAEKHKYNNITTTKKPKGAPFIRGDNDNDYNYDDDLENINDK